MPIRRVAILFDDQVRSDTTGTHCRSALEELVEVVHFRPSELERVPREGFDLYLNIDDGLRYHVPDDLHPSAWWAIDTHMDPDWYRARAPAFDFVFAAQKDGAERLREEGISDARWLPLACNPVVHRKHDIPKECDVCFVGNIAPGPREDLLRLIQEQYEKTFVGQRYLEEMARTYSAARIVFNRSVKNDVNMRVFEALGCGSLLLTNALPENGQAELFEDGVHLVTYGSPEELLEKIAHYLQHEDERERIAATGREEVLRAHTYRHRMDEILRTVEERPATSGRRPSHCDSTNERGQSEDEEPRKPPSIVDVDPDGPSRSCSAEAAGGLDNKEPEYFDFLRPELLALIPHSAKRVLDIGCGAGRLGEAIKQRQPARVIGIELSPAAAEIAKTRLDGVVAGDVETLGLPSEEAPFDCIVCGDVLEHLRDPENLLRRARTWLADDGCLIASIPNVRHHSVVTSLLDGNWTYEPAGLLDGTHLRFFTRRDIVELFQTSGFSIAQLQAVPGPGYDEWRRQGQPGKVKIGQLMINGLPNEEAEEFFVYQYLIVTCPEASRGTGPQGAYREAVKQSPDLGQSRASLIAETAGSPSCDGNHSSSPGAELAQQEARTSPTGRRLSILYVGDFRSTGKCEQYMARGLHQVGHQVHTLHDADMLSPEDLIECLNSGQYDCMLFYKGCLGVKTLQERLHPTGDTISEVIRNVRVPCYTWYFDRAYGYSFDPSREVWMRNVAPLCRVAFVTDGALLQTDWARWYVLRAGIPGTNVQVVEVPKEKQSDVGFIGQVYGDRSEELRPVQEVMPVNIISGVFDTALNEAIRSHRIILGPRFPSCPDYWSDRIYFVLGHGGFFLAPEVEGMREEGFLPGVHYAALGEDPVADIRYWLDRDREREQIAKAGQALVLNRFTYEHRAKELARVIAQTLEEPSGRASATMRGITSKERTANPSRETAGVSLNRLPVVTVNYNTAEHVAQLLFSLFRVLGRDQLGRVIVVDHGSTDGSRQLLAALQAEGLIDVIYNETQGYHGPGLNQGVDHLIAQRQAPNASEDRSDYVWVLDSDAVVLRRSAVADALAHMRKTGYAMLGQFQYDWLPEGYAHPSSLILDLRQTFLPRIARFDGSGAPATELHLRLRERRMPICDYPFRSRNYVLHVGAGTVRTVSRAKESQNRHCNENMARSEPDYHRNRHGFRLHQEFFEMFRKEVPELTPERLVEACVRSELLELALPNAPELQSAI